MNVWIAVAFGGATGAMLRYWVVTQVAKAMGTHFPYGTLTVNVLGSFVMGMLSVVLWHKVPMGEHLKMALMGGVLGSFTTFSTFSLDIMGALFVGHYLKAVTYIISSILLGVLAIWLGYLTARNFV